MGTIQTVAFHQVTVRYATQCNGSIRTYSTCTMQPDIHKYINIIHTGNIIMIIIKNSFGIL